jgi:hypothetical protein
VWPVGEVFFEEWLSNFSNLHDKYLACVVLSFFNYYPKRMVYKLLNDSLGGVGHYFTQQRSYWRHESFKRDVLYSSIPGETPNISDSGPAFLRKLKTEIHIPEENIYSFDELLVKLKNNSLPPQYIVFVDDIIGSGEQCSRAMTRMRRENCIRNGIDLIAYAPLIVNESGMLRIQAEVPELFLSPAHILTEEYNLLMPHCGCWKNDKALFDAGLEMIFRTSAAVGIPDSTPADVLDIKGFKSQGLALAFEDSVPDANLGFFFFAENGWKPLIKRAYERITS